MLKSVFTKAAMLMACMCMMLLLANTSKAAGNITISANADRTVTVGIGDSSWYGKEMSVVCYAPGYAGATNDLQGGKSSVVYLDQVKAASSISFKISTTPVSGTYKLVLGCAGVKVEENFSFTSQPASVDTKLAAPAKVKAVQTAATKVKITWNKVTQAVSYDIYRSTSAKKNFKKIGSSKTNSYNDKKAVAGKTNYYKVVAVHNNTALSSDKSSAAKVAVLGAPKAAAKAAKKSVKVSWKKISGAAGYKVYTAVGKKGKFKVSATIKGKAKTKATIKKLKSKKL